MRSSGKALPTVTTLYRVRVTKRVQFSTEIDRDGDRDTDYNCCPNFSRLMRTPVGVMII